LFFEQVSGILCDKTREVLVSDFARWPNCRLDCRVGKQISSKQTEADKFNSKVNQVIGGKFSELQLPSPSSNLPSKAKMLT